MNQPEIPFTAVLLAADRLTKRLAATAFADEAEKAATMREWADAERSRLLNLFAPRRETRPLAQREPTKRYWVGYNDGRAIQLGQLPDTYRAEGMTVDAPYLRGIAAGRESVLNGTEVRQFSEPYTPVAEQ